MDRQMDGRHTDEQCENNILPTNCGVGGGGEGGGGRGWGGGVELSETIHCLKS